MATNYTERVPIPLPNEVNGGLTYAKQSTMLKVFGPPRRDKTVNCSGLQNPVLESRIITRVITPTLKVTGVDLAVFSLERIFKQVKLEKPELYKVVSTAGMLCARLVRGSETQWSNHSWGTAIDLKINGVLDTVNDDRCLRGLLELYRFFHKEGWYWGSEFSREDSMHFELADETIRRLFKVNG